MPRLPSNFSRSTVIVIEGGTGIGKVTKPGLAVPVGEWAINPVPRRMIIEGIKEVFAMRCVPVTLTVSHQHPERCGTGAKDPECPARHHRRALHPRHHRHRQAYLRQGLDRHHRRGHRRGPGVRLRGRWSFPREERARWRRRDIGEKADGEHRWANGSRKRRSS